MTIYLNEETGELEGLYSDEKHSLIKEAMPDGKMSCPRASEIVWDDEAQGWAVHTVKFGVLPESHAMYEDARQYEINFLEERIENE